MAQLITKGIFRLDPLPPQDVLNNLLQQTMQTNFVPADEFELKLSNDQTEVLFTIHTTKMANQYKTGAASLYHLLKSWRKKAHQDFNLEAYYASYNQETKVFTKFKYDICGEKMHDDVQSQMVYPSQSNLAEHGFVHGLNFDQTEQINNYLMEQHIDLNRSQMQKLQQFLCDDLNHQGVTSQEELTDHADLLLLHAKIR